MQRRPLFAFPALSLCLALALLFMGGTGSLSLPSVYAASSVSINTVFTQASQESGVPVALLKVLCQMEGHLSNHGGSPSIDGGYGCMHLVKNPNGDTLDRASQELHVPVAQLKNDMATNIRGGARILRNYALQLSASHALPTRLQDWYGAVAAYSNATTRSTALMYANQAYQLLKTGFVGQTDQGESVTLAPQAVTPNAATASAVKGASTLPAGCTNDGNVEYPGAIDCIVPTSFDCTPLPDGVPCTYNSANRPYDNAIYGIVIHDIEGTAQNALNVFQNIKSGVSTHYIVDSDGTIYQILHEKDIAYQAGNYWYNQHTIGIEHAGFAATGWQWYNATEYLASAKLVAHLLQKYNLPLDRAHVLAHGTIPNPEVTLPPNHVDPGPYWLWDYYLGLIHQQGIAYPTGNYQSHVITLHPRTDQRPYNKNGTETPANFNYFYLYNGPSTASGLIPQEEDGTDPIDVTDNVEPGMSYYYLAKVQDPAGTGDTLYEIWYGEENQVHTSNPSYFAHGTLAWLAVPPHTAFEGQGTPVTLNTLDGSTPQISGKPLTGTQYIIGDAPLGSIFVSARTAPDDINGSLWYEINYNHRQAWVPASEVTVVHAVTK